MPQEAHLDSDYICVVHIFHVVYLIASTEQREEFCAGKSGRTRFFTPWFRNSHAAPSSVAACERPGTGGAPETGEW